MVVKNPISNAGDVGWTPGWATKPTHDYRAHFLYSPLTTTIQPQATTKNMGSQKKKNLIKEWGFRLLQEEDKDT